MKTQVKTVNTTWLARKYHARTTDITKELELLGQHPVQTIEMPSGKVYKAWDMEACVVGYKNGEEVSRSFVKHGDGREEQAFYLSLAIYNL